MRFSRVSFFFLTILALSLFLKFGYSQERGYGDHRSAEQEITRLLKAQGYAVSVEKRPWSPIVRGQKLGCNLLIALRDPDGFTKNRIAELAKPVGPLHYVYRGAITGKPPVMDPLIRGRIVRQIRQFGIRTGLSPVLAVAASPQCDLKIFDWSRLASMA